MLQHGLTYPIFPSPSGANDNTVNATTWVYMDVPALPNGNPPPYVLLSWKVGVAGNPWHLIVGMDPTGSKTFGAGDTGFCTLLNAYAHNPCVLDVHGISRLALKATSASGRQVRMSALSNLSHGLRGAFLETPIQIAADTVSQNMVDASAASITPIPNDSSGNPAKYCLVSWDDYTQFLYFKMAPGVNYSWSHILGPAHNPIILDTHGMDRIQAILVSGSGTVRLRVTPLENC